MFPVLILLLFPLACESHVVVSVRPGIWPTGTAHHKALGGNKFVVDETTANKLSHAVLEKTPWVSFSPSDFPSPRGIVVRFTRTVTPKDVLDTKRASKSPNVFDVGNFRIAVTDPIDLPTATSISKLADVLAITPRHAYRKWTAFSQKAEFGSGAPGIVSTISTASETVSIGDTGLDVEHCMFLDALHPVPYAVLPTGTTLPVSDTGHAKIRAYISVCLDSGCTQQTDTTDFIDGHGTHTSGILAGGYCPLDASSGFARDSRIVFFDLDTNSNPDSIELPSNMNGIFATALANGATRCVLPLVDRKLTQTSFSASFGGGTPGVYGDLADQIDTFVFANPTYIVVVAGGNSGQTGNTLVTDPATLKNGISVGATMISPSAYADGSRGFGVGDVASNPQNYQSTAVASFTSTGPTNDGRTAPLVAAPGVQVLSAESGGAGAYLIPYGQSKTDARTKGATPGHFTEILMSGTSMAAPNLPVATFRARIANITSTSPASVRASSVRATVLLLTTPALSTVTWTSTSAVHTTINPASRSGFGTMSVPPSFWTDPSRWVFVTNSLATGAANTLCFTTTGIVSVSLAWDDPPGPALVNVLHLVATEGSTVGAAVDVANNNKRVTLTIVADLRVTVFAPSLITSGPQVYSLTIFSDSAITPVACAASSCSPYEPGQPCSVPNGSGVFPCIGSTLGVVCEPTTCSTGYGMQQSGFACVPGTSPVSCAPGTAWNGTACACVNSMVCTTIVLCGGTCAAAISTTSIPVLSTDPDNWTMGVTYWIGISFWIAGILACLALWRTPTPASLVLITSWNMLCGSLVSNDCVSICSSPGHFAALALMGTISVFIVLLHLEPLIKDDVSVIASIATTGILFLVFYFAPSSAFVAALVGILILIVIFYARRLRFLIFAMLAIWAVIAVLITDPVNTPVAFVIILFIVLCGAIAIIQMESPYVDEMPVFPPPKNE